MSPFFVLGKIYKINTKYAARNVLKGYESQPKANNLRHFAIQRARAPLFVFHFAKLSRFWRPLAGSMIVNPMLFQAHKEVLEVR